MATSYPYPPSPLYNAMSMEELKEHVQMLKDLATEAQSTGKYLTPIYNPRLPKPTQGVPIYCPDGRVLKAHSEADAQTLCYDLNLLNDRN